MAKPPNAPDAAARRPGPRSARGADTGSVDALRLKPNDLARFHDALDRAAQLSPHPRREWRRWVVRNKLAEATFSHPGGNSVRCIISPRTLSAGGAGLLHGGFVYTGTRCTLHLISMEGHTHDIPATVVRCTHLGRHVHHIGIRFNERIEPRNFLNVGDGADSFTLERVPPEKLQGRALVIEAGRTEQRLLAHLLKDTKVEAEYVTGASPVLEAARQALDLILLAHPLRDASAPDLLRKLREAQIITPIIVMTADERPAVLRALCDAGASAVVSKPLDAPTLHRAMGEFLVLRGGLAVGAGVLTSLFASDESMQELITGWVREVDSLATEVQTTTKKGDTEAVRAAIARLKGGGAPHGFPLLSEAAAAALRAIDEHDSLEPALQEIRRLVDVCRRCSAA